MCSLVVLSMFGFRISPLAADAIELTASGNIVINYEYEDEGLGDVTFYVYKIASLEEDMSYTLTEDYQDFGIDIEKLSDYEYFISVRDNLEQFINHQMLEPTQTFITNDYGQYNIKDLDLGLYYIQSETTSIIDGRKTIEFFSDPIMLAVGQYDPINEIWLYYFTVYPKISAVSYYTPIPISVTKVWENIPGEFELPSDVSVQLFCDGEVYDEVILNEDNAWTYAWEDLDYSHMWAVLELDVSEEYEVQYSNEQYQFVITNTYIEPEEEEPEEEPKEEEPEEEPKQEDPKDDDSSESNTEETSTTEETVTDTLPQTGSLLLSIQRYAGLGLAFILFGIILNVFASRKRGRYEK
ncbi:MAG: Cna B-type domain-containing protein [Lachnospiraceae bacterium]